MKTLCKNPVNPMDGFRIGLGIYLQYFVVVCYLFHWPGLGFRLTPVFVSETCPVSPTRKQTTSNHSRTRFAQGKRVAGFTPDDDYCVLRDLRQQFDSQPAVAGIQDSYGRFGGESRDVLQSHPNTVRFPERAPAWLPAGFRHLWISVARSYGYRQRQAKVLDVR